MADDLAQVIDGGTVDVLGHSMGGKAAMVLAVSRPELIRRLVVADIAPVAYTHSQIRYVTAMQAADLKGVCRRSEAEERLAETVDDPALRAFFLQSLDLKSDPPKWRLNLDVLGQSMDAVMGFPKVSGRFDGPVLMLSGAQSDYVLTAHRPAIKALFPNAKFAKIPGAGHWLHAEKPREFMAAVAAFLNG
ncbi:MAG: alpha/beta fold hydrolase [Rhodobacteraceae bacterium]|nr:alpha/beta fold hydrolase [Paracoccaceae bacterium]